MILCAALKLRDKDSDIDTKQFVVVPCRRHGEGYKLLRELLGSKYGDFNITEGFIDTENNFYDRRQAFTHARKSKQLPQSVLWYKSDHNEPELHSEDLY